VNQWTSSLGSAALWRDKNLKKTNLIMNSSIFVNEDSKEYFEEPDWPTGYSMSWAPTFSMSRKWEAVAEWVCAFAGFLFFRVCGLKSISFKISGKDLLPVNADASSLKGREAMQGTSNIDSDNVQVRLLFEGGMGFINRHQYENAILPCESSHQSSVLEVYPSFEALESDHKWLGEPYHRAHRSFTWWLDRNLFYNPSQAEAVWGHRPTSFSGYRAEGLDATILALIGYLDPIEFGSMSEM
jgi:hypothetical protein